MLRAEGCNPHASVPLISAVRLFEGPINTPKEEKISSRHLRRERTGSRETLPSPHSPLPLRSGEVGEGRGS